MKSPLGLALFIGIRYTFSRHEQKFISFVSLVSLLGTVLGVATMVLVLSVMNGFDKDIKQRLLAMIPHAFVESEQGFENWQGIINSLESEPGIVAAAPWVEGKGLASFEERTFPIQLNGIEPEREQNVSLLAEKMRIGALSDLKENEQGIILGQSLARRLGVTIGDKLTLLLPDIIVSPVGVYPRKKRLRLIGIFRTGTELDAYSGLISLSMAQKLFIHNAPVNRIRLKTTDIHAVQNVVAGLEENWLPRQKDVSISLNTWADTHKSLFAAVKMEKRMIALLLFSVVAVAVFNIVSILIMMVADKRKEIAILRVMGASQICIRLCFIVQGLLVSVMGIAGGLLLGSVLVFFGMDILQIIEKYLLDGQQLYLSRLPSDWRMSDVMVISGVALVMSLLATLYPAGKSAQVNPVSAINQ